MIPGTDNWYRNHFPVIFETNASHFFGEKIYNDLNISEQTIPTIEFGQLVSGGKTPEQPYEQVDKLKNLSHIFNKDQIEMMTKKVGKSIYFTHVFTELVKARKSTQNFDQLIQLKVSKALSFSLFLEPCFPAN